MLKGLSTKGSCSHLIDPHVELKIQVIEPINGVLAQIVPVYVLVVPPTGYHVLILFLILRVSQIESALAFKLYHVKGPHK